MFGLKSGLSGAKLRAIDTLRANVMIADADLKITYMNASVKSLLAEVETELKALLPRFSMETLLGSNIDVFHKNPSYQRDMLAKLTKPHNATIRVGGHAFDLLVTPLIRVAGRRASSLSGPMPRSGCSTPTIATRWRRYRAGRR